MYGGDMAVIDIQTGEVLEGHKDICRQGIGHGAGVDRDSQGRSSAYVGDAGVQVPFSP